ncbi:MAG TPA: acyl-CoA dehydrogenase family protein [Steroidobacteraceae bacterium]|jgi:alkylation response protein AidB-like acyl-CoA dehydrogenase
MEIAFEPQEAAFVREVRTFLGPWRGLDQFLISNDYARLRAFYRALGERNWLALSWPVETGGLGHPAIYEFILWDEMAGARIARPPLSSGIVAKTIIRSGTPAQRARWLEPIRTGQLMFSLGYSEPEAGSDLAGLRTTARRDGNDYVVNGTKIWSSGAHDSDYLWLLCRTDAQSRRADGLSLLIVDLKSCGLRIRLMAKMSGNVFTELTFDDVRVPAEQRIGAENGAWPIMQMSLADERHVQFPPKRVRADFEAVWSWIAGLGLDKDPVVRHRLAALAVDVLECQALALKVLSAGQGTPAILAAAENKRASTDAIQRIARAAMEFGCPEAVLYSSITDLLWRQTTEESIGGGTSEIMTGIIARLGLGLKA